MSKRVLICEDDCAIRLLLDKLLSRHGLAADCVGTGAEAVMRLRREAYDLIVLDLLTPVLSGYQVLDLLQHERPDLLDCVVIVTASQHAFSEVLPVAAVIRKPFDVDDFDRVVTQVLRNSSRNRCDRRVRQQGGLQ